MFYYFFILYFSNVYLYTLSLDKAIQVSSYHVQATNESGQRIYTCYRCNTILHGEQLVFFRQ